MGKQSTTSPVTPRGVLVYIVVLCVAAVAVASAVSPLPAPVPASWLALPVLAGVLFAATSLVVPFRQGRSVDAVNLLEAALAPLLLAYPPLVVIAVAALAQVIDGIVHRLPRIKTVHNTAMWALAAAVGAAVVSLGAGGPLWPNLIVALLGALAVIGVVNNVAVAVILTLAERESPGRWLTNLLSLTRPAWLTAWGVNAAMGLLFALAVIAAPPAAVLLFVPLIVLHLAHRSYTAARADQERLASAHRAAAHLTTPLDPRAAIPEFLQAVAECYDASAVELVIGNDGTSRDIHRAERFGEGYAHRLEPSTAASLEGALAAIPEAVRLSARGADYLSRTLAQMGARSCLAAPLLDADRIAGAILVLDQGGFAGSKPGELAVLEALARETSAALARGRLLEDVLDKRRKLAEIVDSTSDGILTLSDDGVVMSWNAAFERIAGLTTAEVVGTTNLAARLRMRTGDGRGVDLSLPPETLPPELFITTPDGARRHLACSYSTGGSDADSAAVVMVARDVTPADEQEALREEVTRLVEADAARRVVVEKLQTAVVPAPIYVRGAELAAAYEPSDPSAPTGGDLFDWQVLPSGEVHVAVVDVLGHGVAATKDALAVVHTLRVLTAAGTPLGDVVCKTDELLRVQHPELVATVLVARYDPGSGRLLVASGGHPPALVVTPRGQVHQVVASGGVIGWPGAGSDGVAETLLEPGDAAILYTDGLVEAHKNILDGLEDLERYAVEVANLPADKLAEELVARALAGAERRDDTLALVLRREPVRVAAERSSWTIAPDAAAASRLRRTLGQWLRDRGVEADDVVVVAGELLANAIRAARTRVALNVRLAEAGVVLDVSDDGAADAELPTRGVALPDLEAERGRGLYLVREKSSNVDVLVTGELTLFRATVPAGRRSKSRPTSTQPPQPVAGVAEAP